MTDRPTTRPGELSRLAGGDEYRLFMLEKMIDVSEEASANKEWRKAHDASDKAQFAELRSEIAQIKQREGAVSSSVSGLETDRAKVVAGWKALAWGVGALASLSLALAWIGEKILAFLSSSKP